MATNVQLTRDSAEAMRQYIADMYRKTNLTQQQIADMVGVQRSVVNTAISKCIPLDERAKLVSKRRRAARLRPDACPHCGRLWTDIAQRHPVTESPIVS